LITFELALIWNYWKKSSFTWPYWLWPLVHGFAHLWVAYRSCGWLCPFACGFKHLLMASHNWGRLCSLGGGFLHLKLALCSCWWLLTLVGGFVHLQCGFHILLSAFAPFCSFLLTLNTCRWHIAIHELLLKEQFMKHNIIYVIIIAILFLSNGIIIKSL
jgi:hypothetical protein